METTFNHSISTTYTESASGISLWKKFMTYCKEQEENRLLWVGIILAAHGCILTPMAVMLTLITGPNFFLFMTAMVGMGIALVTNLAAMPTKVTIPAFALSILMDIAIVVSCIASLAS